MLTVNDLITKVTTEITLNGNIRVAQKTLLDACGATPAAAAKRALYILEDSSLRPFLVGKYPKVTLTEAELKASPSIGEIKKKILPFRAYIEYSVPAIGSYIPRETVEVLTEYLIPEDQLAYIAVLTFVVVVASLKQAGDL